MRYKLPICQIYMETRIILDEGFNTDITLGLLFTKPKYELVKWSFSV